METMNPQLRRAIILLYIKYLPAMLICKWLDKKGGGSLFE